VLLASTVAVQDPLGQGRPVHKRRTKGGKLRLGGRVSNRVVDHWGWPSASEDPRGVDVLFDTRSRGVAAQHVMSLLDVVTLINKYPDGAIQHRQFGEAGQPRPARDRWKINVELNHPSVTVQMRPTMTVVILGGRSPVDGDAPEGVAQVGGEIGERARGAGVEDDSARPIDRPRTSPRGRRSDAPTGSWSPSVKAASVTEHWFSTIVSRKPQ
jgi:hypothetical protein